LIEYLTHVAQFAREKNECASIVLNETLLFTSQQCAQILGQLPEQNNMRDMLAI